MKVLVTGGAGFIGTHLTRQLLAVGHTVTILDNFSPQIHAGRQSLSPDIASHVQLLTGDVADYGLMSSALQDCEGIVHLAAETGTGQSMYEISRYERTNLAGTAVIYDLLAKAPGRKVERIVVASSRAIYGEGAYRCQQHSLVYPEPRSTDEKRRGVFEPGCPHCGGAVETVPTPEDAPLRPTSFYGLTKQVQEQIALMFGNVLAIPSFALRYQNVFGPGQSLNNPYTGILAIFSNLARAGKTIQIFEDGEESRDFVYVDDVVQATVACLSPGRSGCNAVNVGSGERVSVSAVAQAVNAFFGAHSDIRITGAFREGDIRHGMADLSRARSLLGYKPEWKFAEGLKRFLSWARENELAESRYEESLAEMKQRGLFVG